MQILPHPLVLPGKCSLCGSSDNTDGRKYIDIGFEIDFYGVIYFCTHCFSQIADAIGFSSAEVNDSTYQEMVRLSFRVSELEAENVKLRVALNNLDFLGSAGSPLSYDSGFEKPVESERSDNPKSSKSIDEPGSTNVSKTGKSKPSIEDEFDDLDLK